MVNQHYRLSPDAICQELGGETVILDLNSDFYFGLDETGTRIWQLLESGQSSEEVLQSMLSEYDTTEQQLRDDLNRFLDSLLSAKLIEPTQP